MKLKLRGSLLAILFAIAATEASAVEMKEKEIPRGWELSATLALFRNLPFLDVPNFPATHGDVHFFKEEESREENGQKFINTYHFYRETEDGKFLELRVVEEQHMALPSDSEEFLSLPSFRVADLKSEAAVIERIPEKSAVPEQLSKLIGYILDHGTALLASQAGDLAKKLNYQVEGRVRAPDYVQPRITCLEDPAGKVEKVRIYGLDSLIRQIGMSVELTNLNNEAQVLEMSIDPSGQAQVSFSALKAE